MKSFRFSLLILLTFIAMATMSATAQTAIVGVHAGATIYDPSTDIESIALSTKEGLVIGGMAELFLLDQIGFRFGIDYSLREAKFSTTSGTQTGTYSLSYLDIPVSLKFRFGTDNLAVYIFGGTTIGTLLSATTEGDQSGNTAIDEQLKPVDLSADVGGGISLGLSQDLAAIAEATYSFGLLDVAEESSFVDKWKARTLKLVVGLNYNLF